MGGVQRHQQFPAPLPITRRAADCQRGQDQPAVWSIEDFRPAAHHAVRAEVFLLERKNAGFSPRFPSRQNSVLNRTAKLREASTAVPENTPAKLIRLSRFARLKPSA